jgi:hypothetical protein
MAFVTARAESPNSGPRCARCARSVGRCVILRTGLVILHHDVPCFLVQEMHTIGDALEDSRQDQAPTHNWAIATSTFMMAPRLSPPPAPSSTRRRGGGETEATLTLVAVQVTRQSTPWGGAARRQLARARSAGTSGARAVRCSPRHEVVWRVPASTKSSGGCPHCGRPPDDAVGSPMEVQEHFPSGAWVTVETGEEAARIEEEERGTGILCEAQRAPWLRRLCRAVAF